VKRPSVEWPTLLVTIVLHAAWLFLTAAATRLPAWVVLPFSAFVVAWHGSLQHETIHGHPTRSRAINALVGSLPVGLWMPYEIYRSQHVAHHKTNKLTDPLEDPESFYVTPEQWRRASFVKRALLWTNTTLVGRLTLGPLRTVIHFWASEATRVLRGDFTHARAWGLHLLGLALVLGWLEWCGLSLVRYVALFVYPGLALTLLRSFAEHRPAATNAERIGVVETNPLLGLLFLNNNLHVVHHDEPALPWYAIPARYRETRANALTTNGGFVFPGYAELFVKFGFRSKDAPMHPNTSSASSVRPLDVIRPSA
jgi:fatty acid desaturase